jgi:hypothetical protein
VGLGSRWISWVKASNLKKNYNKWTNAQLIQLLRSPPVLHNIIARMEDFVHLQHCDSVRAVDNSTEVLCLRARRVAALETPPQHHLDLRKSLCEGRGGAVEGLQGRQHGEHEGRALPWSCPRHREH